ncbi:MAG: hypothetical protein R2788_04825 [Saprospiraceae bacterium]
MGGGGNWLFAQRIASGGFLGLALLTYFIWQKNQTPFSWFHVLGGGIFLTIVGGYYLMYALKRIGRNIKNRFR